MIIQQTKIDIVLVNSVKFDHVQTYSVIYGNACDKWKFSIISSLSVITLFSPLCKKTDLFSIHKVLHKLIRKRFTPYCYYLLLPKSGRFRLVDSENWSLFWGIIPLFTMWDTCASGSSLKEDTACPSSPPDGACDKTHVCLGKRTTLNFWVQ